ncbi:MAG: sialidase family protein [Pirellulaceae bacterium]
MKVRLQPVRIYMRRIWKGTFHGGTPLSAAISTDVGQTWKHVKDIENRTNHDAAYPSVTFVGNEVLVAYYSRSTKWKRDTEITLRIFEVDQFYA